ncbi:MAG TPA: biopolymer transporter ExbD [Bdellovibrionota bacterium]|nr:biopolymer transporter ExbD [Bdellovibrionota bacterium]
MAGGFGSSDDDVISGINVTPLVDVVLVLLIIFLITAPVIYQSAIKVQLPKAKTGEEAQKSAVMLTLTKDGELLWDKERIDWKVLADRLGAMSATIAQETAMISADETTPHGTVIRLMDALRQAGLSRFALSVDSSLKK